MIRQASIDSGDARTPTEQPRVLRSRLRRHCESLLCRLPWPASGNHSLRTLGVTSCHSGEGVSTVAGHLALAAAGIGNLPVLLVDANFARPGVPRIFGVRGRPGMSEVLKNHCSLGEVLQCSPVENLKLLPAGKLATLPRDFDPEGVQSLFKELAADFELVVVDLPAVEQTSAALRLARLLDGVLLVVEAKRVQREHARRICGLLRRVGARPVGVALNKCLRKTPN